MAHPAIVPAARRMRWLVRFRIAEYANRRAEELSKGNQQKVQFIAAILHEPEVLLMDEPFTGLDPVNLALLREAFLELRDQGRTVVFSTHQMELAEAMCESVAIVDRGRVVAGGTIRDLKRASGRRIVRIGLNGSGDHSWLDRLPGVLVRRSGVDRTELELTDGIEPDAVLAAAVRGGSTDHPLRARRAVARDAVHRARRACPRRRRTDAGALMARLDPLLPNAAIVARREYRDRVRSRLFLASTVILMTLALGVALAPIAVRYLDARTVTQLAIVSVDAALAERAVGVVDAMLNNPPQGVDQAAWQKPFRFAVVGDPAAAESGLSDGAYAGVIRVDRRRTAGCTSRSGRRASPTRRAPSWSASPPSDSRCSTGPRTSPRMPSSIHSRRRSSTSSRPRRRRATVAR